MTSRETILARVRTALTDTPHDPAPYDTAVTRDYLTVHAQRTPEQRTTLLAENLADYRAHVHHTNTENLPGTIARLLTAHHTRSAVIPDGLPPEWLAEVDGVDLLPDTAPQTPHDLDTIDTVITGCALAIAETGTIVLDGRAGQGQRRITLVPDHHICVIHTPTQIVDSVPQALPHLNPTRPLTWISGPSATSDIELDRVEGVHGPRTLDVILVNENGVSGTADSTDPGPLV